MNKYFDSNLKFSILYSIRSSQLIAKMLHVSGVVNPISNNLWFRSNFLWFLNRNLNNSCVIWMDFYSTIFSKYLREEDEPLKKGRKPTLLTIDHRWFRSTSHVDVLSQNNFHLLFRFSWKTAAAFTYSRILLPYNI